MALQPAMFPEIEGQDFTRSEEVERVAQTVLSRHGRAGGIPRLWEVAKAIRDEEIRVLWLLNTKPFDPEKDEVNHDAVGKCVKAPGLWRDVTGYDVAIWLRAYFWDLWHPDQREAFLLHELLHVEVRRDTDNQAKVAVRKHDVEDFVDVVRHYGTVVGDSAAYVRAATIKPADASDEPSLTISHGERSVTIDAAALERLKAAIPKGKGKGGNRGSPNERCPFPSCIRWADHAGDHDLGDA